MILTDKNRNIVYCYIAYVMTAVFTIEYIHFILRCLKFGKYSCCNYVPLTAVNLMLFLSLYLNSRGKFLISKHLFFTTMILLFVKVSFLEINFFYPVEAIAALPLLFAITFIQRRYILFYSIILLITVVFLQTNFRCYDSHLYSFLVVTIISVSSVCLIYKLYSEKVMEIQKDSYNKLYNVTFSLLGRVSELKDDETQNHQERVGIIVKTLLKRMKTSSRYSSHITKHFMRDVINGSYLHDIGKIAIEDSILLKKGKYSKDEFNAMKLHTVIGADILNETREKSGMDIYDTAVDIVKYHHERWDGSGYPEGLKGREIPLAARIMAVADVYDALVSKRRYKKAFSHDEAYSIIVENSAKHFDPDVVKCFRKTHQDIYRKIRDLL